MSRKTVCDLCGGEIGGTSEMYSLEVTHMNAFFASGEGNIDLHDTCMFKLNRLMEHCSNGKMARLDEVLQSMET